jgi:hypothetical protein
MPRYLLDEREHRRGLVLGLTLAEVLILLLFLLLLALGARLVKLQKDALEAQSSLQSLQASLATLQPLLEAFRRTGQVPNVDDLLAKLARVHELELTITSLTREVSELRSQLSAFQVLGPDAQVKVKSIALLLERAAKINPSDPPARLKQGLDVLDRLGPNFDPERLSELAINEELSQKNTALGAEVEKLRRQVENMIRSGKGTTYPSCWADAEGLTEYVFDVTIRDNGLIVVDATQAKANDPAWKLVEPFARDTEITAKTFQTATKRMFDWSKDQNCRFFAIIRDGTGPTSKEPYKRMRTLVENHFYPKLVNTPRVSAAKKDTTTGSIPPPAKKAIDQPSWKPFQ